MRYRTGAGKKWKLLRVLCPVRGSELQEISADMTRWFTQKDCWCQCLFDNALAVLPFLVVDAGIPSLNHNAPTHHPRYRLDGVQCLCISNKVVFQGYPDMHRLKFSLQPRLSILQKLGLLRSNLVLGVEMRPYGRCYHLDHVDEGLNSQLPFRFIFRVAFSCVKHLRGSE